MADANPENPLQPPHPGERLASYFENFFRTVLGIATLGASITFSKIVQAPVNPFDDFGYSKYTIQWFLAISWLLFVLALAFTSFFASLLSLYRPQAVKAFGTKVSSERRKVMWYVTLVSSLLFGLVIGAFVFASLVVVGYAGAVGWITVGFCVIFGTGGFGTILYQSPIFTRAGESEVLSPIIERPPTNHYSQKQGLAVQEKHVGSERYGEADAEAIPGYRPEWRTSRRGDLRVQEFNNRWRKDMYDTAYHQRQ
jgi:hypothetical protein